MYENHHTPPATYMYPHPGQAEKFYFPALTPARKLHSGGDSARAGIFYGNILEQNSLLPGNQLVTFSSTSEFSKNWHQNGTFWNKTPIFCSHAAQNHKIFQCMNQGNIVRQYSSTKYNRRHNRGIGCNMHSVSFSLLRFFWTSKRNEGQLSSAPKLKPGIKHISNPVSEIYSHFMASTERSELERQLKGLLWHQNGTFCSPAGNQLFTFCSTSEFSKNWHQNGTFWNKTQQTGTILFPRRTKLIKSSAYKYQKVLCGWCSPFRGSGEVRA